MTRNIAERRVGGGQFEYGNHTIIVSVIIEKRFSYRSMNSSNSTGYHRKVHAEAERDGECEVTNEAVVFLEKDLRPTLIDWVLAKVSDDQSASEVCQVRKGPAIPSLETQLEKTIQPVFDELDEFYEFTTIDYEIDVEASMEQVKHDMSWVEVKNEFDQLTSEIDAMADST